MNQRIFHDFVQEESYFANINGLRVNIVPKKGYSKAFAMITTKYGSKDIEFSKGSGELKEYPKGIAHFLEHKLFEEKEGNIFDRFAQLGAAPNAYTNFQITTYYFTCTEGFLENLRLLIKFVYNPYFTEENVNKEKGIIEQEIRMYEDNPNTRVYYNALESMYSKHPVRFDIAGTVESIYEITPELLYECYNTFYVPENMVLTIVGDVDIDETIKEIESHVPTDRGKAQFKLKQYDEGHGVSQKYINKKMGLSIPNFILGYKDRLDEEMNGEKWLKRKLQMDILCRLLFTRSSELYEKMYNDGYINESFSYEYTLEMDYANLIVGGESREPQKVAELVQNFIKNNTETVITKENFERIRKMLVGAYISRFNSIEGLGNFLNDYYIRGVNPFKYYDELKSITLDEIAARAKELTDEHNWVLSVVE